MNQKSNVNCSANSLADLQQHDLRSQKKLKWEPWKSLIHRNVPCPSHLLVTILYFNNEETSELPPFFNSVFFDIRVQCDLLNWCPTANNNNRISDDKGFLSLSTDTTVFITSNNLLASLRIWSSSHFWRWFAQEKTEQCRSNLRKWNQKWRKTKPGRNWFCFHWGWALIEHFPRGLGIGEAVWVPAHYIFFKWLALQLPLQLLLYFVVATWELSNNPGPKATISLRTFLQYYRIFDIIASHIMLQGNIYTD